MKTDLERFQEKIIITETCYLWNAYVDKKLGYGWFKYKGAMRPANRVAWILSYGEIKQNLDVCHKDWICPNKHCVNLKHLYLGTRKQNVKDAMNAKTHQGSKMLDKKHCPSGHEYNEENTAKYKNTRYCKICKRSSRLKSYHKKKEQNAIR